MTELAYLADGPSGYVRTFSARVTALPPGGVVLDRTYFYPTGGGQPFDRGLLRGEAAPLEVVEVTKSGPSVLHRLRGGSGASRGLAVGSEVTGEVDWERRHQHMRLHTAQHLASARVFSRTGLRTRRAILQGLSAFIDLEAELSSALCAEVAKDLTAAHSSPRAVHIRHVPRAEWDAHPAAPRSGLVPLPPQVDPVRVIEIEGEDSCPCGGTHLRSTGEIGELAFADPVPASGGGTRMVFRLVRPGATTPPE